MKNKILELIEKNRISSVEVADALNKSGVLDSLVALNDGKFICGEIFYISTYLNSNAPLHKQIEDVPEGKILYIDGIDCENRAIFGDIVSKYLMLYKRAKGIIVNGMVRDVHRLKKEEYPIWTKGVTPLGCFNKEVTPTKEILEQIKIKKESLNGSIAVCDDSGCVVIKKELINQKTYEALEFIELQEDIWYFCIDTLKKSTYETICKKFYLNDKDILPPNLKEALEKSE